MTVMDLIFCLSAIIYILHSLYVLIKSAKIGTLYLWSPVIVWDLSFIEGTIVPYIVLSELSSELYAFKYVTYWGLIIGVLIHFALLKYNYCKPRYYIPNVYIRTNVKRKKIIYMCVLILLGCGIYTGVFTSFISGGSVEDLRRTSEVGIGFIRDIPIMFIQLSLFVYLLISKQTNKKKLFLTLLICLFSFLSTGNKAIILTFFTSFLVYLLVKYRGFKLWQFLLFKFSIPVAAGLLNGLRQKNIEIVGNAIMNYLAGYIWIFQVNTFKIIQETEKQQAFLGGDEFWASCTRIVPRFLWPNKPVSYDYYYKELIGYEFEGGGTPIPDIYRFFTNFGYSFPIYYLFFGGILFFLYKKMNNSRWPIHVLAIYLFMFSSYSSPFRTVFYFQLVLIVIMISKKIISKRVAL